MSENNAFDAITLTIWGFFERMVALVAKLLLVAAETAYALARRLLDILPARRMGVVWRVLDDMLEFPGAVARASVTEEILELAESALQKLSSAMRRSPKARLAFLAIAMVALTFHLHPPSHWGPWHRYQTGWASYYSSAFAGKKTASGEVFDPDAMTAAHRSLRLGSVVRVENIANGKTVYVRINDRGPYAQERIIDLSKAAAEKLGMIEKGTARVKIYIR